MFRKHKNNKYNIKNYQNLSSKNNNQNNKRYNNNNKRFNNIRRFNRNQNNNNINKNTIQKVIRILPKLINSILNQENRPIGKNFQ